MMAGLFIGEVARRAGVPVSTVRYYQRHGLLDEPVRRESGYREYAPATIERLRFIRQGQELGFTLKQVKGLIAVQSKPEARSEEIREEALRSINDIRLKIAALSAMETSMMRLLNICNGDRPADECPILQQLQSYQGEHDGSNR